MDILPSFTFMLFQTCMSCGDERFSKVKSKESVTLKTALCFFHFICTSFKQSLSCHETQNAFTTHAVCKIAVMKVLYAVALNMGIE